MDRGEFLTPDELRQFGATLTAQARALDDQGIPTAARRAGSSPVPGTSALDRQSVPHPFLVAFRICREPCALALPIGQCNLTCAAALMETHARA